MHKKPVKKAPPHQIPVTAVKVVSQDFQTDIAALGAAQAWTSDMVFAQASGKLIHVNFTEGSEVKAGQLLAEVDPRPYQAAVAQADGTLKRDEANLAGARRDLDRFQHLQGEGGVSRQQFEDQQATVGEDEGTVELDRGSLAAAKINLEFCRIVAPVSGRTGVRLVDPGNIVSASGSVSSVVNTSSATSAASPSSSTGGSSSSSSTGPSSSSGSSSGTGIVVVNQIQPIAITFTVPQGEFQRLVEASDGFKKPLPVQALSQETGAILDSGELRIADNRVDQNTGSVELKARFPNASTRLWPGQFVNVRLGVRRLPNATVIPLAAVNRGPNGQYVFVVGPNNKVAMRAVTLATTQGQVAVVKSGVKAGDVVVVDGQMVLNNGSLVRVTHMTSTGNAAP
ncbi:efflux RND transporter periplasmic adaptor subunit [Caulobacter sp. S45]|uniref:efflux RND transporter periplasmic adaptor subunit n=1 Tax=Caulobacter sp. S45 TaxID=1641861 RepID=UPI00131E89EB|nr:efflux RND transporter periplasmic adaptor subunit [Caulobacter sp. S45]